MAHFFRRHKFARMSSEVNSEIDYKDVANLKNASSHVPSSVLATWLSSATLISRTDKPPEV